MQHLHLCEHQRFDDYKSCHPCERYDRLYVDDVGKLRAHPLIHWTYTPYGWNENPGYYASYNIGAQWVDKEHTEHIIVTTKERMENIDFIRMFMTCFNSGIEVEEFNKIYEINVDEPPIKAPSLQSVVSPLIIIHFLSVVGRIKSLKKGYVHHSENLKKVKGRINILKNERQNILLKRFHHIYCEYDDYSIDIPENRLIKKALLFSKQMVVHLGKDSVNIDNLRMLLAKDMAMFEQVSPEVEVREVKHIKGHKLYAEYNEAVRIAKLILRYFDYNINNVSTTKDVVPFVIDMSLLYEHYVLGLLKGAYREKIVYQYVGNHKEKPDFLYCSNDYKAILDTKYKPSLNKEGSLDIADVRQLSGYGRDLTILDKLGYKNIDKFSPVQDVPCIIIYPSKGDGITNPFIRKNLKDMPKETINGWSRFYKINVDLPILQPK